MSAKKPKARLHEKWNTEGRFKLPQAPGYSDRGAGQNHRGPSSSKCSVERKNCGIDAASSAMWDLERTTRLISNNGRPCVRILPSSTVSTLLNECAHTESSLHTRSMKLFHSRRKASIRLGRQIALLCTVPPTFGCQKWTSKHTSFFGLDRFSVSKVSL